MVAHAHFISAEVSCDYPGIRYDDYYYLDAAVRSGKYSFEGLGTTYLGSPCSARQIKCYDKAAELLHAGRAAAGGHLLRIEAVLRPSPMPMAQLAAIRNPFTTLLPISRQSLSDPNSCIAFGRFRHLVRKQHYPAQRALERVAAEDKRDRPDLIKALRALAPSWWEQDQVWSHIPAALESLVNLEVASPVA